MCIVFPCSSLKKEAAILLFRGFTFHSGLIQFLSNIEFWSGVKRKEFSLGSCFPVSFLGNSFGSGPVGEDDIVVRSLA